MKRGKKGFTLVELIAVIVLLAVIMLIASLSVSSIRYKVRERQFLSLVESLELAAEKYAANTGVKKLYVQTLIDNGFVEADDETKQIHDPRNEARSLNCNIINITDDKAKFDDETKTNCEANLLSDSAIKIQYCPLEGMCTLKDIDSNKWYKEKMKLVVVPTQMLNLDLEDATYRWINPLAPDDVYSDKDYILNDDYVNDTYQVTVTKGGVEYTAYTKVKVDRIAPKVSELKDINPENWNKTKSLSFKLIDNESGLDAYGFSNIKGTAPTTWKTIAGTNIHEYDVKDSYTLSSDGESTIYVWARDKNGNTNASILDDSSLNISNVDLNIDEINASYNPVWPIYKRSVTITGTAKDNKSGLTHYAFTRSKTAPSASQWQSLGGKTNDKITKTNTASSEGLYYFWVKDAVGNTKWAEVNVNNIDQGIDSVTVKNTQTAWVTSTRLQGTALDTKSGLVAYQFSTSASTPSSGWTYFSGYNSSSDIGIKTSTTVYGYATSLGIWYLWVLDAAGNPGKAAVNVTNVGRIKTQSLHLNSRSTAYLSDYIYDSNIKAIQSATVNNGRVNASISGSNRIYVSVSGGTTRTGQEWNTYTRYPNSYSAYHDTSCARYYCPDGGSLQGSYCVGNPSYYEERGSSYTVYCSCNGANGYHCTSNPPYTTCSRRGYRRTGGPFDCSRQNPEGQSCSSSMSFSKYCYFECSFDEYRAECQYYNDDYSCDWGDTLSGSRCYYCNSGEYLNRYNECEYERLENYTYWDYTATVTYVVSP